MQRAYPLFIIGFLFSPLGYAPTDMPVKAKRNSCNYSLPITVKKPDMLCLQKGFLWLNSTEDGEEQLAYECRVRMTKRRRKRTSSLLIGVKMKWR